jgi:hypothetical protein
MPCVDFRLAAPNNRRMAPPQNVRRVKNYSAATGVVYTYYFHEVLKARRGLHAGTEYIYIVGADRAAPVPVRVFVRAAAVRKWSRRVGRELTGTEEYAVAKMRLFRAFDEEENLAAAGERLIVDDSNLDSLLEQLDL